MTLRGQLESSRGPRDTALWVGSLLLTIIGQHLSTAWAQPAGGDVYREYRWTNSQGDAGGSLRVGGRVGYGGGAVDLPHDLDLQHAQRAELVLEKVLCHAGTQGLAVSVNDHDWITVPESPQIPVPQWEYQHHCYPVVPVPLAQLKEGRENQFRLRVSSEHSWNWPQNLIYGVHLRIYYDSRLKPHTTGRLIAPLPNSVIGDKVLLEMQLDEPVAAVRHIDLIGCYDGVNWEGDGVYRQWHFHYSRAVLAGQIATLTQPPWRHTWDTSWVPDQSEPVQLAARITDRQGITYQTPAVTGLKLERPGLSVELCRPYDVPQQWVTRSSEHTEKFEVRGDLSRATAARLVWSSWSPGYMEGLLLNGSKVLEREGPRYACFAHNVPLEDLSLLQPGENQLTTGKTPKYNGKMVHGMEVNWPGIMVLIQYRK